MPREYLTPIETARQRFAGPRPTDAVQTTENVGDPDGGIKEAADEDRSSTRDRATRDRATRDQATRNAELEAQERRQRHGTR